MEMMQTKIRELVIKESSRIKTPTSNVENLIRLLRFYLYKKA